MQPSPVYVVVGPAQPAGGAPVAVFVDAPVLDAAAMQSLAATVAATEAVFVLPPRRADCTHRLRVFTPWRELPFSVNAALAAGAALGRTGTWACEQGVLALTVTATETADGPGWSVALPRTVVGGPLDARALVAEALGLTVDGLDPALPVATATAGVAWLLVPLRDKGTLGRARVTPTVWARVVEKARVHGVLAFVPAAPGEVDCRVLPTAEGAAEIPASGTACGPLGVYLRRHGLFPRGTLRCHQGVSMGCPSALTVTVDADGVGDGAVRVHATVRQRPAR